MFQCLHQLLFYTILFNTLFLFNSFAYIHVLAPDLAQEVLSESVPTAFAPSQQTIQDYELEWVGVPLPDVELQLGAASLEWVRVADLIVLPRARLIVKASEIEAGLITNGGFAQNLVVQNGVGTAQLPIALLSNEKNLIQMTLKKNGIEIKGAMRVRFSPKNLVPDSRVYTDPSCSSFGVSPINGKIQNDQWIYVGCRLVYVEGAQYRTSSLEMFIFWDNIGQSIEVGGIKTQSSSTSVWPLRLNSSPGKIQLKSGNSEVVLSYFIPEKLHLGFLGVGIGPYTYVFETQDADVHTIAPVLTLYGSYFITESMRVVAFDATSLHKKFFTDFGIYLNSEYIKTLDRRFILNIMLGAHVIGFPAEGKSNINFGAPQGMEMIFKDAFKKGYNFSAGAFIYPPIKGKLYYNTWVRWGGAKFFAELNYIAWQEMLEAARAYSRSVGITIGFPLIRFF